MSTAHEEKIARIVSQLRARSAADGPMSLQKESVSHFVPNPNDPRHKDKKVNVRDLKQILSIDPQKKICIAEPGVTFCDLVQETLKYNLVPKLVPELKTITVGGAVSGCSVESMSYKYGGFHDSCLEYEVITAHGEVLTCSKTQNADVFHMIHGSYGTLGIISKITFELIPAKPYVRLDYVTYPSFAEFQKGVQDFMARSDIHFIDGILHAPDKNVLCAGTFVDTPPQGEKTIDYTWLNIFYKNTARKKTDYFTTFDYFFRYDTECHWLSRTIPGLENKVLRFLAGKFILGSTNLLTWSKRLAPLLKLDKRPNVVVDVFIPSRELSRFYELFREKIGYFPLWIVPYRRVQRYPWLNEDYEKKINDDLFIDVAIYGLNNRDLNKNYYKIIEDLTHECHGIKTLISHNFYDREKFWTIYNRENYQAVKQKTDPRNLFRDLYGKFNFG